VTEDFTSRKGEVNCKGIKEGGGKTERRQEIQDTVQKPLRAQLRLRVSGISA